MDSFDPIEEYLKRQDKYHAFSDNVEGLVRELLLVAGLEFVLFESRIKDVASLRRKIEEYAKNIDSLDEIGDIVGLRVVFLHQSQLELAEKSISAEFRVYKHVSHEYDTKSVGTFGYRSRHLVVSINSTRSKLTEWNRFKGFRAEIQLRTVLQHAWAAHSHGLDYKPGTVGLEDPLRRGLSVLSAQLEQADKEFQALRDQADAVNLEYGRCIAEGRLEQVELTTGALRAYLDVLRPALEELRTFAAGLDYDSSVQGRLGSMEEFVALACHCGVDTLDKVSMATMAVKSHERELASLRVECDKLGFRPAAYPFDLMTFAMCFDHEGARKKLTKSSYYSPKLRKAFGCIAL